MFETDVTAEPIGLFIAFVGGVVSILSPCVLPILPGLFSMVSGMSAEELRGDNQLGRRVLILCALFSAGFSSVFIVIGLTATELNRVFLENSETATRIGGVVLIFLALFLLIGHHTNYRFFMIENRPFLREGITDSGAFITGAAFGFGWSPCIGPILAGVLTYAAIADSLMAAVLVILAYCLGLSIALSVVVYSSFRYERFTNFLKRHLDVFIALTISIMLFFGVILATNQMTWLTNKLILFLDSVGLDSLITIG